MIRLAIHNRWALGDTVCLSALVRDIQLAYPGQYEIYMTGHYVSFWENSPYCRRLENQTVERVIRPEYLQGIRQAHSGSKIHFLTWFHRDFERQTGLQVPVTAAKGDIHLSDAEKQPVLAGQRYWLIVAGGKHDMTTKVWHVAAWQKTVDLLREHGITCVQAGARFHRHFQPELKNVIDMVGKTDAVRDLFRLIYHADGVICGITAAMHIAAVFDKPCVVIAGGREEPWWEAYVNDYPGSFGEARVKVEHRFLHTLGLLDCCAERGCWKDLTVPLTAEDERVQRKKLCYRPVRALGMPQPECLTYIRPEQVVQAVLSYSREFTQLPVIRAQSDLPAWSGSYSSFPVEFTGQQGRYSVLDHPLIGGKFTVCVLCYGDYPDLARRCLSSILRSLPRQRLDLRVALNQPSEATLTYVRELGDAVTKIYLDQNERKKYPAMREMFWDISCPILTPYVCWFDDDSHVIDEDWAIQLANTIVVNHTQGSRLYGTKYIHDLRLYQNQGYRPKRWFETADWWQGKPWFTAHGQQQSPEGTQIVFATGGFFALEVETLRQANIPDVRLVHNGGDITIGMQVHQAGYKVCDFSRGKRPIAWSDAPPRGSSHPGGPGKVFPWSHYTD